MHRILAAVLGAAALTAAGCGDSKDKTSSPSSGAAAKTAPATAKPATATPLTKAEFVSQADIICRDVKQATKPYEKRFAQAGSDASIKDFAPAIQGIVGEVTKGQQALRTLAAPTQDRAKLDAFLTSRDSTIALFGRLQAAAQANDEKAAEKVMAGNSAIDDKEAALARAYGFKFCGLSDGLVN